MLDQQPIDTRTSNLRHRESHAPLQSPVSTASFFCGLTAGVAQAGVFNPYDRALYLSVKDQRAFLDRRNWQAPYSGFWQSLGGRALSGGLYFPLEHLFLRLLDSNDDPTLNFVGGTAAGAVNAIVLNPLSAIKYKTWGKDESRGMWTEAWSMMRKAQSWRPFWNGLLPTLLRDVIFGGCYTWFRFQFKWWFEWTDAEQYKANMLAAAVATVASGPLNYARNLQYATSSTQQAETTAVVLLGLYHETMAEETVPKRLRLLQQRLRVGWGTARVALGMSFGHYIYDSMLELKE